ncbi:MAG: DUF4180 domain-containing protein [Actinomycetota bacterium]|nr:DUF4180 domain-containing protein [Actinomycetota bacterium]
MKLTLVDENGMKFVEGVSDTPFLMNAQDINRLIEACFSEGGSGTLLYAANLPPTFFDLSSGDAGVILQKLRNYRIRLAVVAPPGSVVFSSRFGELVADERRGGDFGLFATRDAARDWLRQHGV